MQCVRESLNNIYKHANATQVKISLTIDENQIITVSIKDNGIGLQNNTNQDNHYGLIIMRDRVEILNGNLTINSKPNLGTEIVVTFKATTMIPVRRIEE